MDKAALMQAQEKNSDGAAKFRTDDRYFGCCGRCKHPEDDHDPRGCIQKGCNCRYAHA